MKKTTLFSVTFTLLSAVSFAQGFYFRAGLGYAMPQAAQSVYNTPIPYYEFASAYSGSRTFTNGGQVYNIKQSSFSSGLQTVLGFGYMFTDNIGVQMDAAIGLSNTKYSFNDINVPITFSGGSTVLYNVVTTQQAKSFAALLPSLVLQTKGDKLNLYTRVGIALPLNTKITQHQALTNAPNTGAPITDDFEWQIKNSFSLGYTAAVGVKYKISEKISLWGEMSLLSMSAYTREQDLKSWVESGQGISQGVSLNNYGGPQQIKFSKTATVDSTYSSFPAYAQPFSNISFNLGITINISSGRDRSSSSKFNSDIDNNNGKPYRRR